jgi:hypothetical protein
MICLSHHVMSMSNPTLTRPGHKIIILLLCSHKLLADMHSRNKHDPPSPNQKERLINSMVHRNQRLTSFTVIIALRLFMVLGIMFFQVFDGALLALGNMRA